MNTNVITLFKHVNKKRFGRFLHCQDSGRLKTVVLLLQIENDFSNKTLEGKFSDEKFGTPLILSHLSEGNSPWTEATGLANTSLGGVPGFLHRSGIESVLGSRHLFRDLFLLIFDPQLNCNHSYRIISLQLHSFMVL